MGFHGLAALGFSRLNMTSVNQADGLLSVVNIAPNKNFIVAQTDLLATEWDLEASVVGLNYTGCQAAAVVTPSNVEWCSARCRSGHNCSGWNVSAVGWHPVVFALAHQHLVRGLNDFTTPVGYVATSLTGNGLARNMDTAVVGPANQQLLHVAVMTSNHGIGRVIIARFG